MILATDTERQIESTRSLINTSTQLTLHATNIAFYGQVAANEIMADTAAVSTASSITSGIARIPSLASHTEHTFAANPPVTLDLKFGND